MNQLTYLVNWGKNKETAWSGTNYSLYKALQKYYDIHDVNLSGNHWVNVFMRRILRMDWMQMGYYRTKMIRHQLRNVKGNVFQFGEYLNDTDSRKTYMYVDCTLGYVDYLRTQLPDIFAVSAYQDIDPTVIDRRMKAQGDYIKNHCSGLFTMGHWLREWLIEQGVDASLVHAVGGGYNVDTQLISPQPKTHNKILFVGKDFKRKGGYITYDAFKLLREQGENVELFVIGPQENPIEDPVAGYHFIGQIPFNEEAKYYNMCDIFCMPSYFEAYGLVFVEALTFGLPCIGRDCYEMPYFIDEGNTGLLLRHDDPHELATLMLTLLRDPAYQHRVSSLRPHYLQEYSWDAVAERMAKVIG